MTESRTDIAGRHCQEWDEWRREQLGAALASADLNEVKRAKTLADCIRIAQDGERRAWNFAEGGAVDGNLEVAWGEE